MLWSVCLSVFMLLSLRPLCLIVTDCLFNVSQKIPPLSGSHGRNRECVYVQHACVFLCMYVCMNEYMYVGKYVCIYASVVSTVLTLFISLTLSVYLSVCLSYFLSILPVCLSVFEGWGGGLCLRRPTNPSARKSDGGAACLPAC